jgi:hypothetical protein
LKPERWRQVAVASQDLHRDRRVAFGCSTIHGEHSCRLFDPAGQKCQNQLAGINSNFNIKGGGQECPPYTIGFMTFYLFQGLGA